MHVSTLGLIAVGVSVTLAARLETRAADETVLTPSVQAANDYNTADASVVQARQKLATANWKAANVSAQLDQQRQDGREIRDRLTRGDAALPDIQKKIDSAAARLKARQSEMAVEDIHYAPLKFADDQAHLEAIGQFERSANYRASLQSVTDAATALNNVQAESLRRLSMTEEYESAASDAQSADANLIAARKQFNAGSINVDAAAKVATEADAKLAAMKQKRLAADPNVLIAQNRLASAKQAMDAVRAHYMSDEIQQNPAVADADRKLAAEQMQYDALEAAAKTAEGDLDYAHTVQERQIAGLSADRTALDQLTAEMSQTQRDLASAQSEVAVASDELNRALALADTAQQNRETAIASSQMPPQVVSSGTGYDYGSAPVYIDPPVVYAPVPYFGYHSVAIRPARRYWIANRGFSRPTFHGGHSVHVGHR